MLRSQGMKQTTETRNYLTECKESGASGDGEPKSEAEDTTRDSGAGAAMALLAAHLQAWFTGRRWRAAAIVILLALAGTMFVLISSSGPRRALTSSTSVPGRGGPAPRDELAPYISETAKRLHDTAQVAGSPTADKPRESVGGSNQAAGIAVAQPGQPVILRTADVLLRTPKLDRARTELDAIVRRHHGYIGNLAVGGPESAHSLSALLRVPSGELDAVMSELRRIGVVEQESQASSDVTSQYVDLVARISNSHVTEQRLIEVLRERTGRVADVLEVEREIARVREQIERMEAERKNLDSQAQFSSIRLTITEEYTANLVVAPPSAGTRLWNQLVLGWQRAVDNALDLAGAVLGYGPTVLLWTLILFLPAHFAWRRLRA